MPIKIKLSTGERIRRTVAADPSMSTDEIISKLGVTTSQIKAALAYTEHPGRKSACRCEQAGASDRLQNAWPVQRQR